MKTTSTFKRVHLGLAIMIFLLLVSVNVLAGTNFNPKNAKEALAMSQKNNQYLFLLFYKEESDLNPSFNTEMKAFVKKYPGKIVTYRAVTTKVKESEMVMLYANDIPNPALVVFAPNGALMGKFSEAVTSKQLQGCIVSDLIMKITKSVQNRKLVLVLLQNKRTKFNKESQAAVTDFLKDPYMKRHAEIIKADPDDKANSDFLKRCFLKPGFPEATVVLIERIEAIGGVYTGKSAKTELKKILDDLADSKYDDF